MRAFPDITYKAGWTFRWDGYHLVLDRALPCADTPGRLFFDAYRIPFPEGLDLNILLSRLHGLEYHELQEWLRVDGVKVAGPHRHDTIPPTPERL